MQKLILLICKTIVHKIPKIASWNSFKDEDILEYISKLYGIEPGNRIFYFTKSALEKEIKRTAPKAGLEPIRVHDLRHSHASLLIEMGFDILEISERLGHESAKTTLDTYSHLYPDKDTKLAGELNRLRRPEDASEKDTWSPQQTVI